MEAHALRATWSGAVLRRWPGSTVGAAALSTLLASLMYLLTSWRPPNQRPLDLFLPLADAFLHGRVDVSGPLGAELAPIGAVLYVPFPPGPAVVYLPFVAAFGPTEAVSWVAPAVAAGIAVGLAHLLLRGIGVAAWPAAWITAGFASTTLWWVVTEGGTWHVAHVMATALMLAALNLAIRRRWPFLCGLLFALAAVSRLPIGLALPLLVYLYRGSRPQVVALLAAVLLLAVPVGMYNIARFNSPIDFGYALIPSFYHPGETVLAESWFADGILNVSYIPRSIGAMLFTGFTVVPTPPYLRPSVSALSIALAAPIYLFAVRARSGTLAAVSWLAVVLVMLPNLAHGSWGFWQFGYRFILDAAPVLLILLGLAYRERIGRLAQVAVVFGAAVTAYGLWAMEIADFVDRGLPFAP